MRACWLLVILLSCSLSQATTFQSICTYTDQLKVICVPAGGSVTVPCPKLTGEVVSFNLLKEDEVIYNHTCIHDKNAPNCKPPYTRVGVELHENQSVSFVLTGVNASTYGIYRCEGIVMFPPPLIKVPSTLWILVRVEGHQHKFKFNKDDRKPETAAGKEQVGFPWILIVVLVLLGIYSIIVSITAGIIWVKLRSLDSQSDYMNTKPKAPRERKKKTGFQHPIPRHF